MNSLDSREGTPYRRLVRYMTNRESWSAKRRATVAGVIGLVLIAVGVLLSLRDWLTDAMTTVIAIIGVAVFLYGLATGIQVVLEKEPDD